MPLRGRLRVIAATVKRINSKGKTKLGTRYPPWIESGKRTSIEVLPVLLTKLKCLQTRLSRSNTPRAIVRRARIHRDDDTSLVLPCDSQYMINQRTSATAHNGYANYPTKSSKSHPQTSTAMLSQPTPFPSKAPTGPRRWPARLGALHAPSVNVGFEHGKCSGE